MTPQQLQDLPGYGQANKIVKAMGMWRATMTDTERIDFLEGSVSVMSICEDGETYSFKYGGSEYLDVLRKQIDIAATNETAQMYGAYLED